MQNIYRLILIEDDAAFAGSLYLALNKQHLYTLPIEIRTFTYAEFQNQISPARNSSREILVFGGRADLGYNPDQRLLKQFLGQKERCHYFVLTPSLEGKDILALWQPGVSGVVERGEAAKKGLFDSLKRIQLRQQARSSTGTYPVSRPKHSFMGQFRTMLFSFFA
ncbi:hypothetical protein [Rufibacter soli]|jgi:hypothetical protein